MMDGWPVGAATAESRASGSVCCWSARTQRLLTVGRLIVDREKSVPSRWDKLETYEIHADKTRGKKRKRDPRGGLGARVDPTRCAHTK